jgi:hypothetical protein
MYLPSVSARIFVVSLLVTAFAGVEAQAADRQRALNWADLAPVIMSRTISTTLNDGATLKGRVMSVRPEGLLVEVQKTSDPTRFTGTATIPRNLLSTVRVSQSGWKWRVIGSVTGLLGGAALGGALGNKADSAGFIISDGAAKGIAIGGIGGAGLGYLVGHFADRRTVLIQITDAAK